VKFVPTTQNPTPLAFPTWRDFWARLEGVPTLLAQADEALHRRAGGNHQIPLLNLSSDQEPLAAAISAMRIWAEGRPPEDAKRRPNVARRIHAIVQPVLHAVAWPRWLLLERAFLDGSATNGQRPW
jgi:hypothetical protein